MRNIAVITARGGSKRIPQKNIKEFCGKPIVAYSIEAAIKSDIFDEVMVSTDSEEIAAVAKKYGAKVPFYRSEATSNDFAGTGAVLNEVVSEYRQRGQEFDFMCCIYPTAPFVTAEKLQKAYNILIEEDGDTISPLVQFSFPPQRGYYIRNGELVAVDPDSMPKRSQDLEPIYHDAGQFYFYRMAKWGKPGKRMNIILPDSEVQDIDNFEDWKIAEMKYRLMISD
ncbi:MAG: pseudaminic acid cytidylyltransferase [Lachnospiraceae bacterium]|nr:pseudaminic acid cytidylyltransferase [Candidatus Colinaster equi]